MAQLGQARVFVSDVRDNPWVRRCAVALIVALLFLYPILYLNQAQLSVANVAEIYVLLALGLNIVVGFAGLLDLGYAAFFAIGAYVTALLGSTHFSLGSIPSAIFFSSPGQRNLRQFLCTDSRRRMWGRLLRHLVWRAHTSTSRRLSCYRHPWIRRDRSQGSREHREQRLPVFIGRHGGMQVPDITGGI